MQCEGGERRMAMLDGVSMSVPDRLLLSGNEAVALAAFHAGISLGAGYPGTPSTEILEAFSRYGGRAQWSPNEKVALEVAIGVSFGGMRALATMKHVGLNVAADPLFTVAYAGVDGGLVVVSADDPGMSSSQNEQDNRRYAVSAALPMFEPADAQEAYDFTWEAFLLSERFHVPVLLRMTTRVCHSKSVVTQTRAPAEPSTPFFERRIRERVMIPAHARPAHRRLREKLASIAIWNETYGGNFEVVGDSSLGIITSGISYLHVREAVPDACVFKLSCTYPLPLTRLRRFAERFPRCLVIEEGDPFLEEALRADGIAVQLRPEDFRFGELNVARVRAMVCGDRWEEPRRAAAKPPELCQGCPHRRTFEVLRECGCIVIGDIGCYTLGALPPFEAMDSQLCMGASIGMGAGLRHVLPEAEARRVVSVIGDSTFIHSGMTALADAVYNTPKAGHVVLILDNGTTAMTGLQEHPGTGRTLDHQQTNQVAIENVVRALGVDNVIVIDPLKDFAGFKRCFRECLEASGVRVIIVRRTCILAAKKL